MTAMAGVCLYKVNWALLFVWLVYVGGARVRVNVVLRATKTYVGSQRPTFANDLTKPIFGEDI